MHFLWYSARGEPRETPFFPQLLLFIQELEFNLIFLFYFFILSHFFFGGGGVTLNPRSSVEARGRRRDVEAPQGGDSVVGGAGINGSLPALQALTALFDVTQTLPSRPLHYLFCRRYQDLFRRAAVCRPTRYDSLPPHGQELKTYGTTNSALDESAH